MFPHVAAVPSLPSPSMSMATVAMAKRRVPSPGALEMDHSSSSSSSPEPESVSESSNYTMYRRYVMPACYKLNLTPGKSFNTPYFYSPQRPWLQFCLRVFPRGEEGSNRGNVSVYVELRNPNMLSWCARLRANISLSLVGSSPGKKNIDYGVVGTKTGIIDRNTYRFGWVCIMTRDELFDRFRDILKRGRFQFVINMDYTIEGIEYPLPMDNQRDYDCYIIAGYVKYPVHWEIIHAQNPNIGKYLTSSFDDVPEIVLSNANPVAVHAALMFFYCGDIPAMSTIRSVIYFASEYEFTDLHSYATLLLDELN